MKYLSVFFFGLFWVLNAAGVELVKDGRPAAEIAIPAAPMSSVKFAAEELQKHLFLISGAKLPIMKQDAPRRLPNRIHLGYGAPTETKARHSWRVKAEEKDLYLHGYDFEPDPRTVKPNKNNLRLFSGWATSVSSYGSLMAVYDFLDREMGVRWIRPTDKGIYAPKAKNIRIEAFDRQGKPKLDSAHLNQPVGSDIVKAAKLWHHPNIGQRFYLDSLLWQLRHRMVTCNWYHSGHAFTTWWKRFGKKHPEYFARLHDGTRRALKGDRTGRDITMCVSSPALVQQIVSEYRRGYGPQGKHKAENIIAITENDSPGMCTCEGCRAWDMPEFDAKGSEYWEKKLVLDRSTRFIGFGMDEGGSYRFKNTALSDRYAKFWLAAQKELRKINPNITVVGFAYQNTTPPPRHVKLNPNIQVRYVGTPFFPLTEAKMAASRAEWDGWMNTGCTMEFRPNSTWIGNFFPLQYGRRLGEEYRRVLQNPRTRRANFDSLRGEFANRGILWYILARLTYRSDLTVDQICDEYFASFGHAGPALRAYFDYWRKISDAVTEEDVRKWEKEQGVSFRVWNNADMCVRIFKPEHFAEAAKLLDRAEKAAITPEEKEAVAFFRLGLEHARLTWISADARLKWVKNSTPENQKDWEKKRAVLLAFRNAHEDSGISDMGRGTAREVYGFSHSKPRHYKYTKGKGDFMYITRVD